jgi:uncharacterized protein (DUF2344 family)
LIGNAINLADALRIGGYSSADAMEIDLTAKENAAQGRAKKSLKKAKKPAPTAKKS